jgi:DNA mismatch repair protein MutS2
LLNSTEKDLQAVQQERASLQKLIRENEQLKKQMDTVLNKEKHRQEMDRMREQNRISTEQIAYLKDMERKLRQIVLDYKKTENKQEVIQHLRDLLFKKKEAIVVNKMANKVNKQYREVQQSEIVPGSLVKLIKNYQVGTVKEIRGKRAIVQVGQLPLNVQLNELVMVEKLPATE